MNEAEGSEGMSTITLAALMTALSMPLVGDDVVEGREERHRDSPPPPPSPIGLEPRARLERRPWNTAKEQARRVRQMQRATNKAAVRAALAKE